MFSEQLFKFISKINESFKKSTTPIQEKTSSELLDSFQLETYFEQEKKSEKKQKKSNEEIINSFTPSERAEFLRYLKR